MLGAGLWVGCSTPLLTLQRPAWSLPGGALPFRDMRMGRLKAIGSRVGSMPAKVKAAPKSVEGFYSSAAWRDLVRDRKRDADYALARQRAKPGERLILDHKVERKDGGADLDPANTEWLTFSEHQAKTAKARAARARGETWGGGSKV